MTPIPPAPTPEQFRAFTSETAKYRHLTLPYLQDPGGLDVGSQGVPVTEDCISFDLPEAEFLKYAGGNPPKGRIDVRGFMTALPFEDRSLPFIYSSHVIEDLPRREWIPLFRHWASKVRPGGFIVLLVPEHAAWWRYVRAGGVHNFSHSDPEPSLGDITTAAKAAGLVCEKEFMANVVPEDYTIVGIIRVS